LTDLSELAGRLFKMAETLWTNTGLRPSQYAQPVLALIALRQMEAKFEIVDAELRPKLTGRLRPTPAHYQSRGAMFVPEKARFSRLLALPGNADLGAELNAAMEAVAEANPELSGVLPTGYAALPNSVLADLLRLLAPIKIEGDAYGMVFEYFMGEFASAYMEKGGEYFTPPSIVKLIVEIIEPFYGMILDPACRSGGMFVHSAQFVRRHHKAPEKDLAIYGIEKMPDTLKLCRLNLAVHGLSGDIREANTYYDDPHRLVGKFDFLMSNPPFNQSDFDRTRLLDKAGHVDARFPLGLPNANNANYLWINLYYAALNPTGRAGFVMANSASDAGGSERELRKKLVESGAVDCIVSVGPNMFLTVTLPVTLWFLDRSKERGPRKDKVLFVDARHLFRQVTRAHRVFDPDQIEFLANIVRLWRGEATEDATGSGTRMSEAFPKGCYRDVLGLCRVSTIADIEAQGWSLNPGRYVGVPPGEQPDDEEFRTKLEMLQEDLETLNTEAARLQAQIAQNVAELLEA
jgi:type I restriction enzyme M protein